MNFNCKFKFANCLNYIALLCFFVVLFFPGFSNAQDQAANWYFGFNAGVNFNDGGVNSLTDGALSTNEGCSVISNEKGELLFYTNGVNVWDRNHNIMPNGNGLNGHPSSTQSAVIVPKPNSDTIYYIFTIIDFFKAEGLQYSEVDMSLNGGNGAVTSQKNVFLVAPGTEKISAVQHSNGVDYWVTAHLWDSSSFATFKITATGVEATPVISDVGSYHGGAGFNVIGCMKFSPNGKKLAVAKWSTNSFVELFDFNKETGVVSNPVLIDNFFGADYLDGAYGLEFSTNSQYLYVSDLNQQYYTSELHQLDLSVFTPSAIKASNVVLAKERRLIAGLQLGPDGKIYVSNTFSSYLSVIEAPNNKGLSSDYQYRTINLSGRSAIFGLPSFIQSFFVGKIEVENTCFNDAVAFDLITSESIDSVLWEFGDGTTSTLIKPEHTYAAVGDYLVKAIFKSGSCTYNVAKNFTIYAMPIANAVTDYVFCEDIGNDGFETFDLSSKTADIMGAQSTTLFEVSYFESFEDATDGVNTLNSMYTNTSNAQDIYYKISNTLSSDCYDISSFKLIIETETAGTPIDLVLCDDVSNDGVETLSLSQFDDEVLDGASPTDYDVKYYESQAEADTGGPGLNTSIFTTFSSNQELFARLENKATDCFSTSSFNVIINDTPTAYVAEDLFICDDGSNGGKAFFNLGDQTATILNGQAGNVTYHKSQAEAETKSNILPENYENQSATEEIFARVELSSNTECYALTSFFIRVSSQPIIDIDEVWYLCPGESVQVYVSSMHDEYLWNTGETSSGIMVDQAGDYTITVFNIGNSRCSITKTVRVVDASLPLAVHIEINDWTTNSNSVIITTEGAGAFKYSIDGNIYTSSNIFDNLDAGDYTVYVTSESDCMVYSEDIYLLNYPKYFTPNNDGYHDYWKIEFAETEPDLEVHIFDRYGKLIIQLNPHSKGWDGTFNGRMLATSDYWFVVNRPSKNRQYHGHFTLKR